MSEARALQPSPLPLTTRGYDEYVREQLRIATTRAVEALRTSPNSHTARQIAHIIGWNGHATALGRALSTHPDVECVRRGQRPSKWRHKNRATHPTPKTTQHA